MMKTTIAAWGLGILLMGALPAGVNLPLRSPTATLNPSEGIDDDQLWASPNPQGDRLALLKALNYSLQYLQTDKAIRDYRAYPVPGITHDRVERSLRRFRELLSKARSPEELTAAVQREFVFYAAAGKDEHGTVDFTGYFEPTYTASRQPTAEYRYPIYRIPSDFSRWTHPHPTRKELEGTDGLQGSQGRLRGLELVWLRDRLEAYLIQVQGSARLRLTDGSTMTVGYAGKTTYPYVSLGKELVKDGKFKLEELTLPRLIQYFQEHPDDLDQYLPRNQSFVFFRETYGAAATGSLGVPVTANRSIATDKSLMPPGALALIQLPLPQISGDRTTTFTPASRYVLDQDTGSAIKGPGRVDIFMGTGDVAKQRAGLIHTPGRLYYLMLK